ncbi:MFS transporter [Luedemannella helvata]|uniref:Major facilitator superfamily (MFS) profile domain-containing protein n=1 Tax=Luedemannella helvata TaxID=349315 RepID=A0ABN2JX95_9ACTN
MTVTDVPQRARRPLPTAGRWLFIAGVACVTAGVVLQIPDVAMVIDAHRMPDDMDMQNGMGMDDMGMPAGMSMWTTSMVAGMLLEVVGLVAAVFGLFRDAPRQVGAGGVAPEAIEHGELRPIHAVTYLVLTVALVVDIMKPLTIGFVLPGMREEYGVSEAVVSVLPLVALTGTAIGSIVWGLLGDRFGRRTALLLATLLFVATSACGAMPTFSWNLVMCFLMGCSAGGLLPLVFTLVAELTPRRHRGWVAVALGGVGGLGGYLAASGAAFYLEPGYTWRILWLIGLPTGLLLLALSPLIPESPLFLLRIGRREQAEAVLRRYGSHLREPQEPVPADSGQRPGALALIRQYPTATAVIGIVGIVWGLVNFGFLVMLPSQLHNSGMVGGAASGVLARSALYSAPALIVVVLLYMYWHGRRSLALFIAATAVGLGGIALWSARGTNGALLVFSVGMLVLALSGINAMLLPYSAEIYPTALRATGSGFAAAATKVGGVLGPSAMLLMLKLDGGLRVPAFVLGALGLASAALMLKWGARANQPV